MNEGYQGRRHGFLSGGTNRRQVANLPPNTLKIGKDTGFWPFYSRIWRGRPLLNFSLRGTRALRPPAFDAHEGNRSHGGEFCREDRAWRVKRRIPGPAVGGRTGATQTPPPDLHLGSRAAPGCRRRPLPSAILCPLRGPLSAARCPPSAAVRCPLSAFATAAAAASCSPLPPVVSFRHRHSRRLLLSQLCRC